ncbi:MAG: DUF547 domain-containing protein [Rhodospirillaceae bacterium]|nr:DUF547 domain-containing protein [Rhodospirillaceae bacterium]
MILSASGRTRAWSIAKAVAVAAAALMLAGFGGLEQSLAPKAKLWAKWQAHDPASTVTVDHAAWTAWLQRYVSTDGAGVNRVAYGAVAAEDRAALAAYIASLTTTPVSALNRAEQMALWINLYNALTVQVVLDHYPVASIRDIDISPGLFADGPWDRKLATVEGERLSLNDIEHRILRPVYGDNRIHYAVNCAAVGCPNLARTAYTAADLTTMLDAAARGYVNDPRGVRVDAGRVTVSKLFSWYAVDFGGSDAAVLDELAALADPPLQAALATRQGPVDTAYDWALNDAR